MLGYTDNGVKVFGSKSDLLPERILIGKILLRQDFINERDFLSRRPVVGGELSAAHNWNSHRAEIVWGYHANVRMGAWISGSGHASFDVKGGLAALAGKRQSVGEGDVDHPRNIS